jgi:hypothetical protein
MRDISILMEGRASRTPGSRRHVVQGGSVDVNAFGLRAPSFLLAYATVEFPLPKLLEDLRRTFPIAPIFGCTSYEGVSHEKRRDCDLRDGRGRHIGERLASLTPARSEGDSFGSHARLRGDNGKKR